MILKLNANKIAESLLKQKNTIALYKGLLEDVNKGYSTSFALTMQSYVTRLGIILSDCYSDVHIETSTYLGSIDFICNRVLKNKPMYNIMRSIEVNEAGNAIKHSKKPININIDMILREYNQLINMISSKTGLIAFNSCYLKKRNNIRDEKLFPEFKEHKYFLIGNVKCEAKLSKNYTLDKYSKTIKSEIVFIFPEVHPNNCFSAMVKIKSKNKMIAKIDREFIKSNNYKVSLPIILNESDLDRRVVNVIVKMKIENKKVCIGEEGWIFKKTYKYDTYDTLGELSLELSQIYRPSMQQL